jgi:hypothetical protein
VQVGADLLGDADGSGDQSGASVSLSSDGSRIAIGALFNDGETSGVQNSNHGHVRVFEYDESSSSWMKVGGTCDQDFRCTGDIDGEAAWDESGTAVSLSGDGSRVAIGAPENDGAGLSAGHVRVFEYDGSTWTQIGLDIDGGGPDNRAGRFVSLSADGSRVAIGANDYGGTDMSGHVRVYEYDGSSWVLMGSGIDGVKAGDYSCVVSLSSDGSRVAIGALYRDTRPEVPGPVRVFEYDGSDWVQLGFGLYGDANDIEAYDSLAVSLSGDGSRLAVGASYTTIGALTDAGRVRVFELFRPAEHPGWIFELVPTYSGIEQFSGAARAGDGRVVFAPANADHVGVYDPTDDSFTMVPFGVTGDPLIGMNGKFNGAVTAGDGRVVFVPSNANGVGVFNPTDDSFTLVPVGVTGDNKFNGAAVAGDGKVVFAPENADHVGVYDPTDPTDNSFSLVDISVTISTDYKFAGAATARDGRVVFAPLFALGVGIFDSTAPAGSQFTLVHVDKPQNANFVGAALAGDGRVVFPPIGGGGVGVFDPTDDTFTLVDISAKIDMIYKFMGAVVVGDGRVVFAPFNANGVGVFNATAPPESSFTLVDISISTTYKFDLAALAGDGRVVFAPRNADGVGVFNATAPPESSFTLVPFVSGDPLIGMTSKFSGAATAQDGRVVFVPYGANGAGVFDPVDDSFVFVDLSDTKTSSVNFAGATSLGDGRVVFAPLYADSVGVFYPPPGKWCDCCEASMAKMGLHLGRECVILPP